MANEIYIKRGDQIRGPISSDRLRQLIESGKVRSTDLVAEHPTGDWQTRDEFDRALKPLQRLGRKLLIGTVGLFAVGVGALLFLSDSKEAATASTQLAEHSKSTSDTATNVTPDVLQQSDAATEPGQEPAVMSTETSAVKSDVADVFRKIGADVAAKVSDDGVPTTFITLSSTPKQTRQLTDDQLSLLSNLEGEISLSLDAVTGWTKNGLNSLVSANKLKELSLQNCPHVTDDYLDILPESLTSLVLANTAVTDAGVSCLVSCKLLEEIKFVACPNITDSSLTHLAALPDLRKITIKETGMSTAAVLDFEKPRPQLAVSYVASQAELAKPVTKTPPKEIAKTKSPSAAKPLVAASPKTQPPSIPAPTESSVLATAITVNGKVNSRPKYARKVDLKIKKQIETYRDALQKIDADDSLIVVGKASLSGVDDKVDLPSKLAVQCDVLDDGYFVTAVGDPLKPILVAAHGFQSVNLVLPNNWGDEDVMHLEPVTLMPLEAEKKRVIYADIDFDPPSPVGLAVVRATPDISSFVNSPFALQQDVSVSLQNSTLAAVVTPPTAGKVRVAGSSPMPYRINVSTDGYAEADAKFDGLRTTPRSLQLRQNADSPPPSHSVSELTLEDFPGDFLADRLLPYKDRYLASSTTSNYAIAGHVLMDVNGITHASQLSATIGNQYGSSVSINEDGWFLVNTSIDREESQTHALNFFGVGIQPTSIKFRIPQDRLCLVEIKVPPLSPENETGLTLHCGDSRGRPVPNAEVDFRILGYGNQGLHGMGGGFSTIKGVLSRTTDQLGSVTLSQLAAGWYSWTAKSDGLRPGSGRVHLTADSEKEFSVVLQQYRNVHIEVVAQPNGTDNLTGRFQPMVLVENKGYSFERTAQNGGREQGYLIPRSYSDQSDRMLFSVDKNDGAWVVDVGDKDFKDVKSAGDFKPADPAKVPFPECLLNHVYVMKTADNKYLKFKVTKIVQP